MNGALGSTQGSSVSLNLALGSCVQSNLTIRPYVRSLDFAFYIGSTPIRLVIRRFVSQHCLRSTLRLFHYYDKHICVRISFQMKLFHC